jgi:hypothetical protein
MATASPHPDTLLPKRQRHPLHLGIKGMGASCCPPERLEWFSPQARPNERRDLRQFQRKSQVRFAKTRPRLCPLFHRNATVHALGTSEPRAQGALPAFLAPHECDRRKRPDPREVRQGRSSARSLGPDLSCFSVASSCRDVTPFGRRGYGESRRGSSGCRIFPLRYPGARPRNAGVPRRPTGRQGTGKSQDPAAHAGGRSDVGSICRR